MQKQKSEILKHLKGLDDSRNRKLESLNTFNERDAYRATQWLSENRSMFRDVVFEPLLLEINISDPRMINAVETLIGNSVLTVIKLIFLITNLSDICNKK